MLGNAGASNTAAHNFQFRNWNANVNMRSALRLDCYRVRVPVQSIPFECTVFQFYHPTTNAKTPTAFVQCGKCSISQFSHRLQSVTVLFIARLLCWLLAYLLCVSVNTTTSSIVPCLGQHPRWWDEFYVRFARPFLIDGNMLIAWAVNLYLHTEKQQQQQKYPVLINQCLSTCEPGSKTQISRESERRTCKWHFQHYHHIVSAKRSDSQACKQ